MTEKAYGILHGVIEEKRIIEIRSRRRVDFYYMSKGMFKNFMMYFTAGMYVFLTVNKTPKIQKGLLVKNIISIDKVISPDKNHPKIYYDISLIKSGVKNVLNDKRNRLFIDFEMSMPPYSNYENFISEIIQVGYVLTDTFGKEISRYSSYVKPSFFPEISLRTIKFLHITQEEINTGVTYKDLYSNLYGIYRNYNPAVYVWGKNDQLELDKANKLHKLRNFTKSMRFIDLLNLHKIYYGLKNDIGLFNAYNLYSDVDLSDQKHDAFEDALVTKEIFINFKEVCDKNIQIDIKNNQ